MSAPPPAPRFHHLPVRLFRKALAQAPHLVRALANRRLHLLRPALLRARVFLALHPLLFRHPLVQAQARLPLHLSHLRLAHQLAHPFPNLPARLQAPVPALVRALAPVPVQVRRPAPAPQLARLRAAVPVPLLLPVPRQAHRLRHLQAQRLHPPVKPCYLQTTTFGSAIGRAQKFANCFLVTTFSQFHGNTSGMSLEPMPANWWGRQRPRTSL